MLTKVYLNRSVTADALVDILDASRVEIHLREARDLGLSVVEVVGRHPDEIGEESTADLIARGGFKTYAIVGGELEIVNWINAVDELNAAHESYTVELPPSAEEQDDEESWGEFFTDRLDSPSIHFTAVICSDEEQWQHGLPAPKGDRRKVEVGVGNLLDVKLVLLHLLGDPTALASVNTTILAAGFDERTIKGALETVEAMLLQLEPSS